MKTKLVMSLAIIVCSLQLQAATKGTVCIESKLEVTADAAQVAESLTTLGLPEQYFSEKLPFTVEATRKTCEISDGLSTLSSTPLPDFTREGDERTIRQERDGWVSEWQQKYIDGEWVTQRFTRYKKQNDEV